ncbi:hypothetical protein EAF04_000805 [Stromatinia cepivora]|nr:hypothetical protein EAF04_000805 [Stromatinia cepivora]
MRFSVVAVSMFAGAAMAATSTDYVTEEVTITSCAATVTNCPARSTQVSTTIYPKPATTDASGSSVTPGSKPSSGAPGPSSVPGAPADACASQCNASYNSCRSAPDANRATCASSYSSCLGYSPFDNNGSLVAPTACSSSSPGPSSVPGGSAPSSSAPGPSGVPGAPADACASQCNASYNSCRSAPDANRATCASSYASCLGYSPFNSSGSLVAPTACSSPGASSTASTVAPTATSSVPANVCASQCNASYDSCRGAPDANQSTCASDYSACLGYSPFGGNGPFVTPTACSSPGASSTASTVAPTATSSVPANVCASQCNASYNSCRSAPDANRATCASDYASCLGYSPFDNNGSLVTPTACSGPVASSTAAPTNPAGAASSAPVNTITPIYATPSASSSALGVASSPAGSVSVIAITTCIPTVIYSTVTVGGVQTSTAGAPGSPGSPAKPSSTGYITVPHNVSSPTTSTPAVFTGAATNVQVGGAAVAAVFGFAAFFL